jgi:hypothetical protein
MKKIEILVLVLTLLGGAVMTAGSAAAQSCVAPPEGLISWWTGDETTDDSHSNFHATAMGGANFAPGLVGQAFRFDGVDDDQNDYLSLPADALHGLEDMTVELWVHTTDLDEGAILSAANGTTLGSNELLLLYHPSGISPYVKEMRSIKHFIALNDGRWHHIAFVREGDVGRFFVDGVPFDSGTYPVGPLDMGVGGLVLGQEQDCLGGCFSPQQAFDGLLDEVAVYGRALTDDEIWAIADARGEGKCKPEPGPTDDDLMVRIQGLEYYSDNLESRVEELQNYSEGLELRAAELESQVGALESYVGLLLEQIDGLEAQGEQCDERPKKSSRKSRKHSKRHHKHHKH